MQLQHFIVFFFSMKLPYDLYPVSTLKLRTNSLWFSFAWGKSQCLVLFRLIQSTKYIHFLCHLRFTSNSLLLWIWIMANTSPGFFLVEQIIRVPTPRPSLGNNSSLIRWIYTHTQSTHTPQNPPTSFLTSPKLFDFPYLSSPSTLLLVEDKINKLAFLPLYCFPSFFSPFYSFLYFFPIALSQFIDKAQFISFFFLSFLFSQGSYLLWTDPLTSWSQK